MSGLIQVEVSGMCSTGRDGERPDFDVAARTGCAEGYGIGVGWEAEPNGGRPADGPIRTEGEAASQAFGGRRRWGRDSQVARPALEQPRPSVGS